MNFKITKSANIRFTVTREQALCLRDLMGHMTPEEAYQYTTSKRWASVGQLWDSLDDLLTGYK